MSDSPLEWSRGSSRRYGGGGDGGGGALDCSRGTTSGFGGGGNKGKEDGADFDMDRSSSKENNPQVKRYIRRMSDLVADPIQLDLDQRRLQNAVREAGEHSLGIDAITVWMFDEESGTLVHPPGGWWRSDEMQAFHGSNTKNIPLARLEDTARDDYVPPKPISPGTDIAGILWTESRRGDRTTSMRRSSTMRRAFDSGISLKSLDQQETPSVLTLNYQPVRWRDIKSISQDPDSAKGPRLKLMEEAGFSTAAGITFQYTHHQGMVIFLTSLEDRNDERLKSVANSAYLHQAAQFIGAQMSLAELRRAVLAERYKLREKCYSIDEYNDHSVRPSRQSIEEGMGKERKSCDGLDRTHDSSHDNISHNALCYCHVPSPVLAWLHKLKGGSMQRPPPLTWGQSLWTTFGSFVGLLVLSTLNEYYRLLSDNEYHLILGPFGAMCTLMYGLSAAPASQPMNAVLGQAVAGAVSLAFTYIPEHVLPIWLRIAVGPAFAIGTMVKLGVVHPPAGAHSVLYATGKYNFIFYALVVLSTAISVIPATFVNNMSSKRQYPTYWGFKQLKVNDSLLSFFHSFGFNGSAKHAVDTNNRTIVKKNTSELKEGDGLFDGSKRSNTNTLPPRLVIHEEGDAEISRKDLAGQFGETADQKAEDAEKV